MTSAADVVGQPLSADDGLTRAYRERTPGSAASFGAARRVLPGGETRAVTSYPPYPLIITEGHGARLTDVDGHVYLDLVNNYTAMVHGSAFAPVIEAVADLLPRGFAFASPHPHQVALGELLAARLPSVQRVGSPTPAPRRRCWPPGSPCGRPAAGGCSCSTARTTAARRCSWPTPRTWSGCRGTTWSRR